MKDRFECPEAPKDDFDLGVFGRESILLLVLSTIFALFHMNDSYESGKDVAFTVDQDPDAEDYYFNLYRDETQIYWDFHFWVPFSNTFNGYDLQPGNIIIIYEYKMIVKAELEESNSGSESRQKALYHEAGGNNGTVPFPVSSGEKNRPVFCSLFGLDSCQKFLKQGMNSGQYIWQTPSQSIVQKGSGSQPPAMWPSCS